MGFGILKTFLDKIISGIYKDNQSVSIDYISELFHFNVIENLDWNS